jgi:hypothetical protein
MNSAGNNKILSNEKEIPHTQLIYSISKNLGVNVRITYS